MNQTVKKTVDLALFISQQDSTRSTPGWNRQIALIKEDEWAACRSLYQSVRTAQLPRET
jgi:hypothetical protein